MQKLIISLVVISFVGAGCTIATTNNTNNSQANINHESQQNETDSVEQNREKILDVVFKDYNDNEVTIGDYIGTPMVVNSWAVWCPFCVKELPDFAKVQKVLGDSVKIIAINRKESKSRTQKYLDEHGIRNDLTFWLDSGDKFYTNIGGFSMPETILINSKGEIVDHKRGPMDDKELIKRIQDNLNI